MLGSAAMAARETIAALCDDPPRADDLIEEVSERVRRVVPYDTGAWMATDPITRLPTSMLSINSTPELSAAYCQAELDGAEHLNSYDNLFARGITASALSVETGGDLESSSRFRSIHAPNRLGDELRLLASDGDATWGYGCMARGDDAAHFSPDEIRWVASVAAHLGMGVRRALARSQAAAAATEPGMLVLDADFGIEARTGAATRWLNHLGRQHEKGGLPAAIFTTALVARAQGDGADTGRPAAIRVHVGDAGWLLITAAALEDTDKVAVMLESADRATLLPLMLALHGLTEREREVARLLVTGRSTDEIAVALHISRHTLRDHVKAIFAKVGVSSRPALTAALAA